ncbi:phage portal protein [Carnobacterium viridans]|uniref:Phage portal protein, HK97 family n=1 Tax=Carnobacterium viridans TaxID=174587 RepID=A0A1H0YUN1_9LACT|nr:phage portal protein [Carnobacterium viridans]SDQ18947.1 phage portal protein, HK97 family [Carnobacterium viridans]
MRKIGVFNYFSRNPDANIIKEISLLHDDYNTTLMKQRAIDVVVGRIARSLSLVNWKTYEKGKYKPDSLYYHLNVQPNINQNATDFWEEVVRKLFEDTEVLIVVTSDDQFIIADDFEVTKYVLKENVYTKVVKDDFEFDKSFFESKVIRLNYNNTKIKTLLKNLDDSYGMLFNRLVQVAMRTNQIRGTAKLTGNLAKNAKAQDYLQTFVDKIFKSFSNNSEAIVPVQDGMEYTELSREQNTRSQVDELNKVSNEYLNTVLEAVGIHPALIYGDMSDTSHHKDDYISNVIQPMVEKITDEINRKFFEEVDFMKGSCLNPSIVKLRYISIFDIGGPAEKLVGSSTFTPNDVREAGGYERIDKPGMDDFYMTKNMEKLRGGENTE